MNTSKILILCLLLFTSLNSLNSRATGGGDDCYDYYCFSIFNPKIIHEPENQMFLSRVGISPSSDPYGARELIQQLNLSEWKIFFQNRISAESIKYLVYTMTIKELANLKDAYAGNQGQLLPETKIAKTELDSLGQKKRILEFLSYLKVAKLVEPYATANGGDSSWDPDHSRERDRERRNAEAAKVLALLHSELNDSTDGFLRRRVLFQIARLHFYTQQYNDLISFYQNQSNDITGGDSISYRYQELAAGAYTKLNRPGHANYLFAMIFNKFPPLKASAYLSFHPENEDDWKETLALAKNTKEKEAIWQIMGLTSDGMSAIQKIYELNPQSSYLNLLLVREVLTAESAWFAEMSRRKENPTDNEPKKSDVEIVGLKRLELVQKILEQNQIKNPGLWKLSYAHLLALAGEIAESEKYLRLAYPKITPVAQDFQNQVRVTLLFDRVRATKSIERKNELYFAREIGWLLGEDQPRDADSSFQYILKWTQESLSAVYWNQGDKIRALLLDDRATDQFYWSNSNVNEMITFLQQTSASRFDEVLKKSYGRNVEELKTILSTNDLYAGNFIQSASNLNELSPRHQEWDLGTDPFRARIKDCIECDYSDVHRKYSYTKFLHRLNVLFTRTLSQDPEIIANASLEIGNALYNISARGGASVPVSQYGWNPWNYSSQGEAPDRNMDLVEKYYVQAMKLSPNREIQAKACFMAAKAEQNRFYERAERDGNDIHPGKYYRTMKTTFSDTKYYQDVIHECGYFRKWASK